MNDQQIVATVEQWLHTFIVGLGLCPFARTPLASGTVRFNVSRAVIEENLLHDLAIELQHLDTAPEIETTLLIVPDVLQDFGDYNQFLELAERLVSELGYEGIYQIASFHPDYQFAGTAPEDAENYSNRSTYPLLHLLREESVTEATASHTNPEAIPERNIELLAKLGQTRLEQMLRDCTEQAAD